MSVISKPVPALVSMALAVPPMFTVPLSSARKPWPAELVTSRLSNVKVAAELPVVLPRSTPLEEAEMLVSPKENVALDP